MKKTNNKIASTRKKNSRSSKPTQKHSNAAMIAVEGKLQTTKAGYGFVISDKRPDDDVRVNYNQLGTAMNGDMVLVQISESNKGRSAGKIIKVLKRATESFIGTIHVKKEFAFVLPDKKYGMQTDIFIPLKATAKAKDGDRVVAKITDYNEKGKNPVGMITDIITDDSLNRVMWKTILLDHGFSLDFPADVIKELDQFDGKISKTEIEKRRDFRKTITFTIDPADARDFDDAISFRELENGNYEIGVHIADVSHFVTPNTALDNFAADRATSVYLVDGTLPMLPEKLSNELCSLRPDEDKLCFAAVFELDKNAKLIGEWFGKTIIHSQKRFSYEDAQLVLETKEGTFAAELKIINELAYKLRVAKFKAGAINFDTVETKFKLDENGKPVGVILKERKDAHLLIEDFMLLANKQVATFICKQVYKGKAIPFPYRIHDSPDLEKLKSFNAFAKQFGYQINVTSPQKIASSFNEMIAQLKGKPEENILTSLGIRCMAKAIYTTNNIGHYGLGFPFYCHFTSPIRRYPDVMSHRILQQVLQNETLHDIDNLEAICKHSSDREKQASESERDSIKFMQALYLKDMEGKTFDGVVSGVTSFGVFVELIENKCEGMVAIRDLDEPYIHEDKTYTITGKYTGRTYSIGDKVKVVIKKVTPDRREVDLMFVD